MQDYTSLTPEERFNELDRLAGQLFATTRWKTAFCQRYGLTRQTISAWGNNGAPLWALEAVRDALAAQRLEAIRAAVREADQ